MTTRDNKGRRITVWPIYLDSTVSRSMGRRVPRDIAVRHPRVEEIVAAAEALGLDPVVVEKRYPKLWWQQVRAVLVLKRGSKSSTLRLLAREISRRRNG